MSMSDLAASFVSVPRLRGLAERVYEMEVLIKALPPRHTLPPGSDA